MGERDPERSDIVPHYSIASTRPVDQMVKGWAVGLVCACRVACEVLLLRTQRKLGRLRKR